MSGGVPLNLDTCQCYRPWRNQWENHGNDQAALEIFKVFGRFWGSCGAFKTLGLDTHFLAREGSHFGSGICIFFHRRRCLGSQPGQNGAGFGVYPLDSNAMCHCCRFQYGARPAVGDWMGAEPWPEGQHCRARSWAHVHYRSWANYRFCCYLRLCATFLAGRITPEYNTPCKPHIGICLQFTATPTHFRVRQACFPKNFAFPKTVEQVVPSRKRMKSKTKPEEPRKREVKFVCQAEHWKSALQSRRKTRAGPQMWFLSLLGFQLQERKHAYWGIVFRTRRSALLRRMASLSMSASDMVVDLQG